MIFKFILNIKHFTIRIIYIDEYSSASFVLFNYDFVVFDMILLSLDF